MSAPLKYPVGGVRMFGILFICLNVLGAFCALIAPTGDAERAQRELQLALLFFLLGLVSAVGLLRLREWARLLTLLLAAVLLAWDVAWNESSVMRMPNSVNIFLMCWTIYVLWYFLRPSVKAQFQKQSAV